MAEIRQQLQCGDSPAQRAGSPSLEAAVSPENPIYQGALAGTDYTARDASTRNDSATPRADTGKIRGICSPGVLVDERERFARIAETVTVSANGHPQIDAPTPWDMRRAIVRAIREAPDAAPVAEVDRRLASALHDAGRSALGMPGTVDTFKAMLYRAGLVLVLA